MIRESKETGFLWLGIFTNDLGLLYMLVAFALSTVRVIFLFTRRIALKALNREQTYKRSLRQKSNRAGMDSD